MRYLASMVVRYWATLHRTEGDEAERERGRERQRERERERDHTRDGIATFIACFKEKTDYFLEFF
jgi:hypothetical protein